MIYIEEKQDSRTKGETLKNFIFNIFSEKVKQDFLAFNFFKNHIGVNNRVQLGMAMGWVWAYF